MMTNGGLVTQCDASSSFWSWSNGAKGSSRPPTYPLKGCVFLGKLGGWLD